MKHFTLRTALLSLALAASHQTVLSYRITYNSGPDDAKSNINLLVFRDSEDYAKLVKEQKATDMAQKILNTFMNAQSLIVSDCAPELAPEDYVLDEIGDILIGWMFGLIKRIETDIAVLHQHRQQKTGDVMEWTPAASDVGDWIYIVVVIAKNDQKDKGQVVLNMRIKPDAEFGINIKYSPNAKRKNGKGGIYKLTFEPAKTIDDANDAAYILNKDSLLRLHGLELGTSTDHSKIEASLCDWSMLANPKIKSAYNSFNRISYNTTTKEYEVLAIQTTGTSSVCPAMKTFIMNNFEDAWPAWQKLLGQAITVQQKNPGNPTYNNFNNMTTQDMAAKVQGIGTFGGGPESQSTVKQARKDVLDKNNNKTKICQ